MIFCNINKFRKSLLDKYGSNEGGEAFFSKPCDVPDQRAEIKHDHDEQDDTRPQADPEPE